MSQTIRVAILDDALHEADEETFSLALSELRNATAADVSATGTIRDNDLAPPAIAGDLPAALLCVGGAPYELDLAGYFDGEELRFSAVSSTPLVATATLAGSRLTVAPASEGESSVTVTATNDAGSVSASLGVRVVTDPAELEAVESVLASIGRAVLTGVTDSVRARFGPRSAIGEQSASTSVQRGRTQVVPGASAVLGNQWPGSPMHGTRSGGWDGSGFFEPQVSGDDWFETTNRTYRRGMVPFSFSLDSAQSVSTGPAWAVWGRADAHRFESGIDGSSHDGTLTAVHLGADARVGDWLAGVSVARSAADADYRFERSVDACGGVGVGEGMVDAELTSVHPYVGRQIGRGSVWATLGGGGGEVSVERCETGRRNEADLSMRLGALGGRHPFAGGERIEISVVEEIGVLDLTTGDAVGPVGDRSVRVGQARLGLEASGVAPAGCDCSLTTFVRAFARGDWGDGATGTGLELAAGVRFRNLPRRLGIDAGIRALAAHSAEDAVGAERQPDLLDPAEVGRDGMAGVIGVAAGGEKCRSRHDERHRAVDGGVGKPAGRKTRLDRGEPARLRHRAAAGFRDAVRGTRRRAFRTRRRAIRRAPRVRRPSAGTGCGVGHRTAPLLRGCREQDRAGGSGAVLTSD